MDRAPIITNNTALVMGSSGVIGRAAVEHFSLSSDWKRVLHGSRQPIHFSRAQALVIDLLNEQKVHHQLAQFPTITHVFYTAYLPELTPEKEVDTNLRMLKNLVDGLESVVPSFRHLQLMHGQKWYGSHLGAYRTPAKENDPRHVWPNFYYNQQDFLVERQRGKPWTWSALRPQAPLAFSTGSPMNQLLLIGIYGSICRELKTPLDFPGSQACFDALYQVTDAGLLAQAMQWVATEVQCANQAFNVTNGDVFRWANLWPRLADFFGVPVGRVRPMSLAKGMANTASLWAHLIQKHQLKQYALEELVNWSWGDFIFNSGYDDVSSTIRLRQTGFHECRDSEVGYLSALQALRSEKVIP